MATMKLPRVLFVTGKGGAGKSTVAAALALSLSHRRPTTLADLDGRLGAAIMLGASLRSNETAQISDSLRVIALSQRSELSSFIRRIVPVAAISERMLRSRTFGYVTAAVPGLGAVLLMDRLRIMAGDAALEDHYLVVDGPASGTALELLAVPAGVKGVAPVGTLNRLADAVEIFLRARERFAAIIIATPEELAVREALDTARTLRETLGIGVAAALLNRCVDALFDQSEVTEIKGLAAHRALAQRRMADHAAATIGHRKLVQAGLSPIKLPTMFDPAMAMNEITALARHLGALLGP